MSIEEALNTPIVRKKTPNKVVVHGKTFDSLLDACNNYNMNYGTVKSRLQLGWSIEEAFELKAYEKFHKGTCVNINGKQFESLRDACNYFNLGYDCIRKRIRNGLSPQEAFNYSTDTPIVVNGLRYSSVGDACTILDLNKKIVRTRLYRGWSNEEAFEFIPKLSDGNIDISYWNKHISKITKIVITSVLSEKYYKCVENGLIRYYSKEELFEKFKEARLNVK